MIGVGLSLSASGNVHPGWTANRLLPVKASMDTTVTPVRHYIFFSRDREKIHTDTAFLLHPGIEGAQITYAWRQLERAKDVYDFSEIEDDLNFLKSHGKKLFIQVQDVTFWEKNHAVPEYLTSDTAYHGGEERQCVTLENGQDRCGGWYARRWDPNVAARYHKLLQQLAEKFDGRIEGINLPETSIDVSEKKPPAGYSHERYLVAQKNNMKALRDYFKRSVPILYANFMPGGTGYLKPLYDYAREMKVGMGGPDIKVYRRMQMKNSYPLIRELSGIVPTGAAVQDGNYNLINDKTKDTVKLAEILDFAQHYLRLNYVFWCTEEPFYSKEVLPLLRRLHEAGVVRRNGQPVLSGRPVD